VLEVLRFVTHEDIARPRTIAPLAQASIAITGAITPTSRDPPISAHMRYWAQGTGRPYCRICAICKGSYRAWSPRSVRCAIRISAAL
jgi:hypothetical protein